MLLSLSDARIEIRQDPSRLRPSDVPRLLGDCSKFKKDIGWQPKIPFEATLNDMLGYWRQR
jgi:GDP-4-dehydro-6-deoxy-D-mannose reductase